MPSRKQIAPTPQDDLETLRVGLLEAFAHADYAVKAQVAGQLRQVIKDLAALGGPEGKKSVADEIAARRARKTSGAAPAERRTQSRRSAGHHRTS